VRTEQEKQAIEALQRLADETQEYTRQFGTDDNEDYSDDEEDDEEYSIMKKILRMITISMAAALLRVKRDRRQNLRKIQLLKSTLLI